jgi:phosphoribosylformimino-5-aminoimidazole carboxamide ribotide isomerase
VNPLEIAETFERLGFGSLYLADIDAILGQPINFTLYQRIRAETNLDFMVDAGVADVSKAERLLEAGVSKVVIGTETLRSMAFINQAVKIFGDNHVVVSVDMRKGRVISLSESVKSMSPLLLTETLQNIGVNQIILLDLSRVGTECGVDFELVKAVLKNTGLKVLVGGGIRDFKDLEELKNLGVFGVLVATALHRGKLGVDKLKSAGFL